MNKDRIYELLYSDAGGEIVGLYEVQNLDEPVYERIPALVEVMEHAAPYESYQAALILTSWGDDRGLERVSQMIGSDVHLEKFEPHRISGQDTVYDSFAEALYLYMLQSPQKEKAVPLFRKLLKRYNDHLFPGNLSYALEQQAIAELLPDMINAAEEGIRKNNIFQASMLLPAISRQSSDRGWELILKFKEKEGFEPGAEEFIAHALKYIPAPGAAALLAHLVKSSNRLVAGAAENSMLWKKKHER